MSHSSGGVINLDDSDADVEEVGSDVEEIVRWDLERLRQLSIANAVASLCHRRPKFYSCAR